MTPRWNPYDPDNLRQVSALLHNTTPEALKAAADDRAQKASNELLNAQARMRAPDPIWKPKPAAIDQTGAGLYDRADGAAERNALQIEAQARDNSAVRQGPVEQNYKLPPDFMKFAALATKSDFTDALDDEATAHAASLRAIALAPHFTDSEKQRATKRAVDGHAARTAQLTSAMKAAPATFNAQEANDVANATASECVESIRTRKPISQLRAERNAKRVADRVAP